MTVFLSFLSTLTQKRNGLTHKNQTLHILKVVKLIEWFQYQICESFLTLNYNQATLYTDRRNKASLMAWAQSKLKKAYFS